MWPFRRNKFKKLKKEEVQDAIYELEKQERLIEDLLMEKQEEVEHYLIKGRQERSVELKTLYAKKINHLKQEMQNHIAKGSYLLYNIRLLNRVKESIEDKEFFQLTAKVSLGNLLQDQKGLAVFLNNALNTKISAEEVLTTADETFSEIQDAYLPSQEIYGIGKAEDEILSVFDEFEEFELEKQTDNLNESVNPKLKKTQIAQSLKQEENKEKAQISEEN